MIKIEKYLMLEYKYSKILHANNYINYNNYINLKELIYFT